MKEGLARRSNVKASSRVFPQPDLSRQAVATSAGCIIDLPKRSETVGHLLDVDPRLEGKKEETRAGGHARATLELCTETVLRLAYKMAPSVLIIMKRPFGFASSLLVPLQS